VTPPPRPLRSHRWFTPYAFALPAITILIVFALWAFAQVVILSFTRVDLFGKGGGLFAHARFVGLDNYAQALGSTQFWWCLLNSFFYLIITPVIMLVSLLAAMTVTSRLRGLSAIRVLLFLPVVTPTIVGSIAWRVLFREDGGLLNAGLAHVGLGPVPWLTGYPWVLVTAMTVTLWKGFGYFMMIFVAALMAVSPELEEACMIDGAGRAGVFWNVTFPSIRPVLVLVALLSSIGALKVFDEIYVTVRNVPTTSKTIVPLIFDTAFEHGNFGLACAFGVLLFVIVLAFSLLNLRLVRQR
jgi:putative chitobiose transport system permease protein